MVLSLNEWKESYIPVICSDIKSDKFLDKYLYETPETILRLDNIPETRVWTLIDYNEFNYVEDEKEELSSMNIIPGFHHSTVGAMGWLLTEKSWKDRTLLVQIKPDDK